MFKKLTTCAVTVAIFGFGSVALAHTGVKDQGTESKSLYTALTIGHGCSHPSVVDASGQQIALPVVAQSVVFPTGKSSLTYRIDPSVTDPITKLPKEYPAYLPNFVTGVANGLPLGAKGIQDRNIFQKSWTVLDKSVDPKGIVRGLKAVNGNLDPTMTGVIPFRVGSINFVKTSCAKSLQVRLAVANWCNTSQDVNDNRRVDLWMGGMTTKFNDADVMPHEGTELGEWSATVTINRDLVKNPLPAGCPTYTLSDGSKVQGFDVAVQPSPAEIDTFLPIKGYWPAP